MAIKETGLSWPLKSNTFFLDVLLFAEFQILASILIHSISDEIKRPRPLTPRLDRIKDFKIVINGNIRRIFFSLCKRLFFYVFLKQSSKSSLEALVIIGWLYYCVFLR